MNPIACRRGKAFASFTRLPRDPATFSRIADMLGAGVYQTTGLATEGGPREARGKKIDESVARYSTSTVRKLVVGEVGVGGTTLSAV
jgi:hypothetical protein